ncbi:MAG: AAA domain-containing protein [Metamycoplasmataceae bacterium]
MSKTLLSKLNNILEIDKNKEYIYLNSKDNSNNSIIDLSSFINKEELREFVNDKTKDKIEFSLYDKFDILAEEFNSLKTYEEYKNFCSNYEIKLFFEKEKDNSKTKTKKVKSKKNEPIELKEEEIVANDEKFLLNKKEIFKDIKSKILESIKNFEELKTKNYQLNLQNGKWFLKMGFDFICGNTSKKNKIVAPLFFLNIELELLNEKIIIKKVDDKNKNFNEKLFLFINKEEEKKPKIIENFNDTTLLLKNLEEIIGYEIKGLETSLFDEIAINNLNKDFNTIKYSDVFVISLFDVEVGKLKDDFIKVINDKKDIFDDKMVHDNDYYKNLEFIDNSLIQINNPLNIYQKYAVRSAVNENTLIYGPPGTGKSEIIANIIANLIMDEKNLLMVSEKDAALEVIFERLNKLNNFCFYLKNIDNKKVFYKQIENIANHMGSFYKIEEENFSLKTFFQENNRTKDYNKEINAFRDIVKSYISFIQKRDSNLVDYKEYLIAKNAIFTFINSNKTEIQNFYEEYKNKYVRLQGVVDFLSKIAEFNDFKNKYNLKDKDIKILENENNILINFLIKHNYVKYEIEDFEKIENNIKNYHLFLKETMLIKDKNLPEIITNNYFILAHNYEIWSKINQKLEGQSNQKEIKNFLIKNLLRHDKFLVQFQKYDEVNKVILLNRYFYKNEIIAKKTLFNKGMAKEKAFLIVELIKEASELKILKENKYLLFFESYSKETFDPITLFFINNQNLLRKEFVEFYKKKIEYFDERINNQYYRYRVNQIERELILINNYDFEIKNKNQHIISLDIPFKIKSYLKNNKDFINKMDETIYKSYLKYIKYKLSKKDAKFQEKINKMFSISRGEKLPKINEFIVEYLDCLLFIFPIWISKPDLVCHYSKLEEKLFDVGIFDEASQMFLEKAYPILYRCKKVIVAGDNKQLKPEKMIFESKEELEAEINLKEIDFDKAESLLDRAKLSWWNSYFLKNHYRSLSKELIAFSNNNFYDNELEYASLNKNDIDALDVNELNSVEKKNENLAEANKVIEILKNIKNDINFRKILIICFTKEQKELIKKKILNLKGENALIEKFKNKKILVKDISSIQGDEGDISIISCVFSKDSKSFGVLEEVNGANYLNVAITRSKKKMIVVKSILSKDINTGLATNKDLTILRDWISFLESHMLSKKKKNPNISISENKITSFKDDIFIKLKKDIRFKKYQIVQNFNLGSHNGDIVFYEKDETDIKLILLLHDWKKIIEMGEFFEEIDKEEYLIQRKYDVLRIMEEKYLLAPKEIIDQIDRHINPIILEEKKEIAKKKDILKKK